MFKKVLIVEDHEVASISVLTTLKNLGVQDVKYVHYCDHALALIEKANAHHNPYDLLITDIEFEEDDSPQQLKNGLALIKAVKSVQPDLKIIVFTSKDRNYKISEMFKSNDIDALVRKARRDGQHLRDALFAVFTNKTYQSPDIKKIVQERNSHEFTSFDLNIIKLLYEGKPQKEMPRYFQTKGVNPSSLSSIEKRLNTMKNVLGFTNNEQLVAYCKEIEIL